MTSKEGQFQSIGHVPDPIEGEGSPPMINLVRLIFLETLSIHPFYLF
jgi:hypothetical protein